MHPYLATYFGFGVILGCCILGIGVAYLCGRLFIISMRGKWEEEDLESKMVSSFVGTGCILLLVVAISALFKASQQVAQAFGWM